MLEFVNLPIPSLPAFKEAKSALKEFVETGKSIIKDPSYKGSVLDKLDNLLVSTDDVLDNELDTLCSRLRLNTCQTFVEIAAPSLEGKTQSAFTFRKVKPLYFPISESIDDYDDTAIPQPIYNNFRWHVCELKMCANLDMKTFGADVMSAQNKSIKFWTVGFLLELATRAQEFEANDTKTWMEHLAKLNGIKYSKKSFSRIPKDKFAKLCIFLDEYAAETWTVFVRDLARIIGLKCLCANTNSKKANVIGSKPVESGQGLDLWSIVVVKLNSPSLTVLNELYQLEESIDAIKKASLNNSTKNQK